MFRDQIKDLQSRNAGDVVTFWKDRMLDTI